MQHFTKMQEGTRKDVKRCFGVLQAGFAIFKIPSRQWDMATIKSMIIRCVILHNLIIENESNCNLECLFNVGSNVSHLKQGLSFEYYYQ